MPVRSNLQVQKMLQSDPMMGEEMPMASPMAQFPPETAPIPRKKPKKPVKPAKKGAKSAKKSKKAKK